MNKSFEYPNIKVKRSTLTVLIIWRWGEGGTPWPAKTVARLLERWVKALLCESYSPVLVQIQETEEDDGQLPT